MAAIIQHWFRLGSARGRLNQVYVIAAWIGCVLLFGMLFGWAIRVAAFSNELGLALVMAFFACCLTLGYRWVRLPTRHSDWQRRHWVDFALPTASLFIAVSLVIPAQTFVAFLSVGFVLGAEAASWSWALQLGKRNKPKAASQPTRPKPDGSLCLLNDDDANVLQTMTRLVEDDREIIRGTARANFVVDQRKQTLHLALCPPLQQTPEFHCETIEGPEARINVADLQPFGVRLEVTLIDTPTTDESVVVEYYAT